MTLFAVLIEHWLVTDGRTDGRTDTGHGTYRPGIASRGKNRLVIHYRQ